MRLKITPSSPASARESPSSAKARHVLRQFGDLRLSRTPDLLIASLLIISALTCGATAGGATLTVGAGQEHGQKGHHHCKCATRCRGASCCCVSDRPGDESSAPARQRSVPLSIETAPTTGPCIGAAPCSGGVPATPSPIVRIVDTAALGVALSFLPTRAGERLAPCRSDRGSTTFLSRLEEPPERIAD